MRVQTILHPTDPSEQACAALRYAVALAHDYGARLLILQVVPDCGLAALPASRPVTAWVSEAVRGDGHASIEYLICEGEPVATILRTAAERQCDLIVLGSRPESGWWRWLHKGEAEQIVRASPCPVLVVRERMTPSAGSLPPGPAGRSAPALPVATAG